MCFKSAKEMAGIHKINGKTESNVCKQKKMNEVIENLQKCRKYVMERFKMIRAN